METLASQVTTLMEEQKLSSAELARKTGVAQPVVYRIMTGQTPNPQLLTLKPIADYFNVTLDKLAGYTSLTARDALDAQALHDLTNKIATIRTVASTLADIMPKLEAAYRVALAAEMVEDELPVEILPLLRLNTLNLMKAADAIREIVGLKDMVS